MFKILENFPFLEVAIRHLYWKVPFFNKNINKIVNKQSVINDKEIDQNRFFRSLSSLGVKLGDTLIVHSSYLELKRFGMSPDQIIDRLLQLIGSEGTLIMPAIPIFRGQPLLIDRFKLENYVKTPIYDVNKSRICTGALPGALVKRPGSVRSRSPLNSMVIFGRNSASISDHLTFSNSSLPCGKGSVLANSLQYNPKLLFLGVDEVHSMTMIHVVEDLNPERWPIKSWYWKREFQIIDNKYCNKFSLQERRPEWALFYAERRFSKDLRDSGIISKELVDDLNISLVDAQELVDFLNSKNAKGYPYWIPFWYRK
jgi:aminoglycoside 3-N-acetyltransferase